MENSAALKAATASIAAGGVVLAGNSHAAATGRLDQSCGPVANMGIGGATAEGYANILAGLEPHTKARIAILMIGTNEVLPNKKSMSLWSQAEFRKNATFIIGWLQRNADGVIVTAVPPLGRKWEHKINRRSVEIYSDLLRTACLVMTCTFVDPFAEWCDGDTGVVLEGSLTDGIHLVDCSDILKDVNLCIQARP